MTPYERIFHRLLDESSALLAAPESAGLAIPDDDLHREIIVPLLPAMLGDKAIRQHWSEQAATGFVARLARHFDGTESAPRWLPGDFEIHVTASFSAGPDARALADTLLSEESLRDMTAALMNQLSDVLWTSLVPSPASVPAEPEPAVEIPPVETLAAEVPTAEIPKLIAPPELGSVAAPVSKIADKILPPSREPQAERETPFVQPPPSRAVVRALCRKLARSVFHRGLSASGTHMASAAILARRILVRTAVRAIGHNQRDRSTRGISRGA